jgi:hypothetical protein
LFSSVNTAGAIKAWRIRWAEHVAHVMHLEVQSENYKGDLWILGRICILKLNHLGVSAMCLLKTTAVI